MQDHPSLRSILRGLAAAVVIAAGASAATAQDAPADWQDVVAKANDEGRLTVYYVAVPQQMERLVTAFNEAYPDIRVSAIRGVGELPARIAAERQSGADGGDAFIFYDVNWFKANEQHLVPIDSPNAAAFPAEGWVVPGKAANVGFPPFSMLVWNTNFVKEPLTDYQDMLRPEFKGHVGTRDGRDAVLFGYLDFLETKLGPDYLTALGDQEPKFYASGVPLNQAVAAGEVWVANVGLPATLQELKDQGAPVDWAVPASGGYGNPWVGAVLDSAKRPNAARVFLDFTLCPDGQAALNGGEASASPLPGVPGTLDLSHFTILDPERINADVVNEWLVKFDHYFR
jgi:iron(III) transport system substrate-binding protein